MAAVSKAVTAASAAAGGAGAGARAEAKPPLFPFVFVGCWNQPGVNDSEKVPRDIVAEVVRGMSDIKYIVLGGDNVYPRPNVKKIHDPAVFDKVLELYGPPGRIIAAFGNHNVDTLEHQLDIFGLKETGTYYQREFEGNIHMLVLDTNIVLNKPTPDAPATNATAAAQSAYEKMCKWFADTVRELPAGHQYFVVQHEPYFTARFKKGSDIFGSLINADPLLDTMFSRLPIAVLCADTHHYQHAIIQQATDGPAIHQFIVGTGGANPDAHAVEFRETRKERDKYLYTQLAVDPGYGFLRIDKDKKDTDPIKFRFVKVLDWPAASKGGARRTHKHRKVARKSRKQKLHRKRR
jgi:hypothetical protein